MTYEKWMTCDIFISDGSWTIGYVDGEPAEWSGNAEKLRERDEFNIKKEGDTFGVDCVDQYVVKDGQWMEA